MAGIVEQFRAGPFFEVAIFVLASRKVRRCNGSRVWFSDTEQDLFASGLIYVLANRKVLVGVESAEGVL